MKSAIRPSSILVTLSIGLGLALTGLLLIGLTPAPQSARAQGVIYVDADATAGSKDGTSWTRAFTNVQDALAVAVYGDEIWVADGVYYPDQGAGQIDDHSSSTFQLVSGVRLYGGFAGRGVSETQRTQRDWTANVTVLSGDLRQDDATDANGVVTDTDNIAGVNAYHVTTGSGVTETARLDGFTITAGQANSAIAPHHSGGGMLNDAGSPTLANLTFSGNRANVNGGGMYNEASGPVLTSATFSGNYVHDGHGGGMCNASGSSPALTDVSFDNNRVNDGHGGGMFNNASSPTLTRVDFSDNQAFSNGYGGGMGNAAGSSPRLTQVTFSGNQASNGGGMYNDASSPVLITATFSSNEAPYGYGGGMYNDNGSQPALTNAAFEDNQAGSSGGGMFNTLSHPTLTHATFSGNQADDDGGGMYNVSSDPTLIDVTFSDNTAACDPTNSRGGGGMYNADSSPTLSGVVFIGNTSTKNGGGMLNFDGSSPRMTNVAFRGNTTVDGVGGGIYSYKASITLTNALFSGNWGRHGGGIYNWQSTATLTNATFGGNATVDNGNFHYNPGGAIFNYDGASTLANCILWGNAGEQIYDQWASTSTISYSDVAWSGGVYTGAGNINADPRFVAPVTVTAAPTTTGDYRLRLPSPVIDAGDNGAISATVDLDGDPRPVDVPAMADTGSGAPPVVDMGAYESQFIHAGYLPLVMRH